MANFRNELRVLINQNSLENGSNTPDFILAEYLENCLKAFDYAVLQRTEWYRKDEVKNDPLVDDEFSWYKLIANENKPPETKTNEFYEI